MNDNFPDWDLEAWAAFASLSLFCPPHLVMPVARLCHEQPSKFPNGRPNIRHAVHLINGQTEPCACAPCKKKPRSI